MALLAELYKLVLRHGVLPKIIKGLPVISILSFIIGVAWLFVLPLDGQYRNTYISENALMPSQAYSYFRESEWNLLRGYRTQINNFTVENVEENIHTMGDWLNEIGFKTSYQKTEYNTTNLYAIWHSPKSDDTESIVLGAAYFQSDSLFNVGGLSLAISLARYFHRWSIWSKNIILVIPQDPSKSLRSWVNAYHTSLDHYAGSIEGAIMLDFPSVSDNFEYIELFYEGLNGQLPNLDFINTCVFVSEHEGPRISLQGTESNDLRTNDYWSRLRILLNGIKELALTGLKVPHGQEAFSGWRIQALTLKAITDSNGGGHYDITTFGRIPEAIFRSVNNLLEKFHQSFFFFLMLAPRNFVSIATYLPSSAFIVASFFLSASDKLLNEWKTTQVSNHLIELGTVLFGAIIIGFGTFELGLALPRLLPMQVISVILLVVSVSISVGSKFKKIELDSNLRPLLRSLALFYFGVSLSSLLLLNFALTFAIGSIALPLTFVNDKFSKLNNLWLLISNPFVVGLLIAFYEFKESDFLTNFNLFLKNLTTSWTEFGNHTWLIVAISLLPTWLIFAFTTYIDDKVLEDKKNI